MMNATRISLAVLGLAVAGGAQAHGKDLEKISPELAGWSASKLTEAAELADSLGYAAITILYDGKEMFSWGQVERNYKCHSIRKWFLSALYGIYVDKGVIDLDTTIEALGIDDIPPKLTEAEKKASIRQLLQSRSGIYHPAAGETQDMEAGRPERGSHAPGTFFYYNNWDFNTLGVIFEQLTGQKIFDAFKKDIADPIGMQDFKPSECHYDLDRKKSNHPLYAFRMSARDMARFGALYQNDGVWKGQRLLSEKWMRESTTPYSEQGGYGYGYMVGVLPEDSPLTRLVGGTGYFHAGLGVHALAVVPADKYVLVVRMNTDGDFSFPDRAGNGQMYRMITAARVTPWAFEASTPEDGAAP